jgi:hypothetical protein
VNENTRDLAGLHAQRAAQTFLYQVSGYVPADQRRLLYAQVQSILLYEIDRLLMELANHTNGGEKSIL